MRHVYLDIETTGNNWQHGDRIVEIGAVEVWHGVLTEQTFHVYLNPDKRSHPDAFERHGLSRTFLREHNRFDWISYLLFEFIRGARLYMRDGAFAAEFLNAEICRLGDRPHDYVTAGKYLKIADLVESVHDVTDMLQTATLGEDWSLDLLCARFLIEPPDLPQRMLRNATCQAMLCLKMRQTLWDIWAVPPKVKHHELATVVRQLQSWDELPPSFGIAYLQRHFEWGYFEAIDVLNQLVRLGLICLRHEARGIAYALAAKANSRKASGVALSVEQPPYPSKMAQTYTDYLAGEKPRLNGLNSGLHCIDEVTGGLPKGALTLIAARAFVAKELLAFQIAWRAASELGERVLWIDGGGFRTARVAACLHGIVGESRAAAPGTGSACRLVEPSQLTEAEWESAKKTIEKMDAVPFFVDDTPMPQVKDIELQMRRIAKREGRLGLVVLRCLQRVGRTAGDMRPEHQQYREVLSALNRLASELGCAIVVLTTAPQDRQHELQHMPTLNDLPDPVGFARLTEIQLFLHRPSVYSACAVDRDEVQVWASGGVRFDSVGRLRHDRVARRFLEYERPAAVD